MSKNKLLLTILLLSLFIPSTIYADCTKEEIDNFKEIQDDYEVTYLFNKETKTYTLNFENPNPENYGYIIKKHINENNSEIIDATYRNEEKFSYYELKPGKYMIEVKGKTETCTDKLKTIELDLPKYNKYSEDELCAGIEEFVLCQPTYDKDIDYDTFVSRVNIYKNSNQNKKNDKIEKKAEEPNKIVQYVQDNLLQIIIITIFIIMIIITVILMAKSIRKSRRLE